MRCCWHHDCGHRLCASDPCRLVDEIVWVKMTVNRRLAKSHGFYLQHAKEARRRGRVQLIQLCRTSLCSSQGRATCRRFRAQPLHVPSCLPPGLLGGEERGGPSGHAERCGLRCHLQV